jgi:CheY-like chemotaxis protein
MTEKTILLVDDNPDDRELALLAFEAIGIVNQVKVARDGIEALDYLLNASNGKDLSKQLPSLVLLDLKLPKVDGLEVLRRLRTHESTKHLPVVVLTTSTEDQDLVESYKLGCNSYIRKPVDFDEFQEVVRQLGMYWLLLNQSPP